MTWGRSEHLLSALLCCEKIRRIGGIGLSLGDRNGILFSMADLVDPPPVPVPGVKACLRSAGARARSRALWITNKLHFLTDSFGKVWFPKLGEPYSADFLIGKKYELRIHSFIAHKCRGGVGKRMRSVHLLHSSPCRMQEQGSRARMRGVGRWCSLEAATARRRRAE